MEVPNSEDYHCKRRCEQLEMFGRSWNGQFRGEGNKQTAIDVKRAALVKLKQKKFLWNSTWNQTDMVHERQLQAGCSKVNFNNIDQAKSNNIFLNCMYGEGKSECLKSKSLLVCPQMPLDCYQIVWASSADEARLCPEIVSHPRRLSAGEEQLLIIMELRLDLN